MLRLFTTSYVVAKENQNVEGSNTDGLEILTSTMMPLLSSSLLLRFGSCEQPNGHNLPLTLTLIIISPKAFDYIGCIAHHSIHIKGGVTNIVMVMVSHINL